MSLPLEGYDDLTTGEIESHARALTEEQLTGLLAYELGHADRVPVIEVLHRRLRAVRNGAEPSGDPGRAQHPGAGPAQERGAARTEGPPQNPPSQGDPTNPARPAT